MDPELHGIEIFEPTGASADLVRYLDEAVREIDSFRPLPVEIVARLNEELLFDRVHSSAVTEGNRLNRRETIAVLTAGVIEAGSRKDVVEVKNLAAAIMAAQQALDDQQDLSALLLRQLHELILRELDDEAAGRYRTEDLVIAGAEVRPPPFQDVPDLVDRVLRNQSLADPDITGLQRAAWLHWALCRIHPFKDGNGRIARLCQDFVLLSNRLVPSVLRSEDRDGAYYEALEEADYGDGKPLLEMVAENAIRMADRTLAVIRDHREKADWIENIAKAANERVRETRHRKFLAVQRSGNRFKAELRTLADELSTRVPELSVKLKEYGGIDLGQFEQLVNKGRASRTWHCGIEVRLGESQLRYIFWYGTHRRRPDETQTELPSEVTMLVSEEEENSNYRLLDDLPEDRVLLREIAFDGASYWRRRWDPGSRMMVWDRDVSAGKLARDFLQEVLGKLGLS